MFMILIHYLFIVGLVYAFVFGLSILDKDCPCEIQFRPRDLWLGVYPRVRGGDTLRVLEVWVCLLPTLPVYFFWYIDRPDNN